MNNTEQATVLNGTENATKPDIEEIEVAPNLDEKVPNDEAQRKTAVWVEIFYALMFLLVGFILGIYSIVWLADPSSMHGTGYSDLEINSYFAMGIVGMGLIMWGVVSLVIASVMQVKNKTNHKISNSWGIANWFTLNPYSWSLIRQSNGYVSKKQQKKAAKKAAAAMSTDSVDASSDAAQDAQAAN